MFLFGCEENEAVAAKAHVHTFEIDDILSRAVVMAIRSAVFPYEGEQIDLVRFAVLHEGHCTRYSAHLCDVLRCRGRDIRQRILRDKGWSWFG